MLNVSAPARGVDLDPLTESIDRNVEVLTRIADCVYSPFEFGVEPYKLYSMDRYDMEDPHQFENYRMLKDHVDPRLMDLDYHSVSELHRRFMDPGFMRNFKEYQDLMTEFPWMSQMRQDLTEFNIQEMKADLFNLERQMVEWRSKGFMGRLFSKGKVTRETTAMVDRYFSKYNEHVIQTIMEDPQKVLDALDGYDRFSSRSTVMSKMNEAERIYGEDLMDIASLSKSSLSAPASFGFL